MVHSDHQVISLIIVNVLKFVTSSAKSFVAKISSWCSWTVNKAVFIIIVEPLYNKQSQILRTVSIGKISQNKHINHFEEISSQGTSCFSMCL